LKADLFSQADLFCAEETILASNTSSISISKLASSVERRDRFVGLHFFSPVDKMPLVEIVRGTQTSDAALAAAVDVVQQIRKTPIVVNDSRGFFTSRVIGTFINEGIAMLLEGVPAQTIEQASSQAGYPAPVLQLSDELNLKLRRKIRDAARNAAQADDPARPKTRAVATQLNAEQATSAIAGDLLRIGLDDLPKTYYATLADRYASITVADVMRAAQTWFHPDNLVGVRIGPPA